MPKLQTGPKYRYDLVEALGEPPDRLTVLGLPCVVPPTPPLDSYTEGSQGTPRSSLVVRGVRPRSVHPTNYSIIILVGGGPRKPHENLAQATQIGKTDSAAQDSGLREDSAKFANCWPGHTE